MPLQIWKILFQADDSLEKLQLKFLTVHTKIIISSSN